MNSFGGKEEIKMGISPEDRKRIYEEEKARIEERQEIEKERQEIEKEQKRRKLARQNKFILFGCIPTFILMLTLIIVGIQTCPGGSGISEPPAPAPAPTPQLTSSEQAYAITIVAHTTRVGQALTELGELMSNPQMGDDEWRLDVAVQLVTIRALYGEATEIDPPSSMTNIHYKYLQAMKHYATATDLIAEGIDELDANLIDQATTEMNMALQLTNEATKLMEEFTETHSK